MDKLKKFAATVLVLISFISLSAQDTLFLTNNRKVSNLFIKYKNDNRAYFIHDNQIQYIEREEFKSIKRSLWWDGIVTFKNENKWENLYGKRIKNNESYILNKKSAGQSSAGIVFTLIMPSVLSVVAIETGIAELAYASLGFSVLGIGLWLSGVKNLRIANEIAHATHYSDK